MTYKFKDLRKTMSPEAQAHYITKTMVTMADLPLAELHQARSLSQEKPAAILEV